MNMAWRLDAKRDTILLGYTSQMACVSYGGRNWIAWDSPQIPLSDGPYKFNRLPGLIVKISDTKNQHSFTLNSIKNVAYNQLITIRSGSFIEISAEDCIRIMRNEITRYYELFQGGSFHFQSEEQKAKVLNGIKSINNFIEKF